MAASLGMRPPSTCSPTASTTARVSSKASAPTRPNGAPRYSGSPSTWSGWPAPARPLHPDRLDVGGSGQGCQGAPRRQRASGRLHPADRLLRHRVAGAQPGGGARPDLHRHLGVGPTPGQGCRRSWHHRHRFVMAADLARVADAKRQDHRRVRQLDPGQTGGAAGAATTRR